MELKQPNGQLQETLYFLLTKDKISVRQMMNDSGIINLSARLSDLRKIGLHIPCEKVKVVNKFGRKTDFGQWKLANKEHGYDVYLTLKEEEL